MNDAIVLSPEVAGRLKRSLEWFERGNRLPPPATNENIPTTPRLKIGKARGVIATRQFGSCDVYLGVPGSEKNLNLPTPIQAFNALQQYVTAGKWLGIIGQYIVVCLNPAEIIWGTWDGTNVTVSDWCRGDQPPPTVAAKPDCTAGQSPPKAGACVRCEWHDRNQAYVIVSWTCPS